jgi:hypothetical protein
MIFRSTLLLISFITLMHGQDNLQKRIFDEIMQDSVITAEEQRILDLMEADSSTTALKNSESITSPQVPFEPLNQEGRWRWLSTNMSLGNGLYGLGIPYLLRSDNFIHYLGFQGVAAGVGYFYTYHQTRDMEISLGRASFHTAGVGLGVTAIFPIFGLVPMRILEQADSFNDLARPAVAIMMVGAPIGSHLADKLYQSWQPSDAQATLIVSTMGLGAFNGLALTSLILNDSEEWDFGDEETEFAVFRAASTLPTYAAALAGGYLAHTWFDESYTLGDAYMVTQSGFLGGLVAFNLMSIGDINKFNQQLMLMTLCVDGFAYLGTKLVREVDFTIGDASIVGLGTYASLGVWQGISMLAGLDLDSGTSSAINIAAAAGGFYGTYRSVKANRLKQGHPGKEGEETRFRLFPAFSYHDEETTPLLCMQITL